MNRHQEYIWWWWDWVHGQEEYGHFDRRDSPPTSLTLCWHCCMAGGTLQMFCCGEKEGTGSSPAFSHTPALILSPTTYLSSWPLLSTPQAFSRTLSPHYLPYIPFHHACAPTFPIPYTWHSCVAGTGSFSFLPSNSPSPSPAYCHPSHPQ